MIKNTVKTNSHVNAIFDELDRYRNFCREFGYRFDEAELYNYRSNTYKMYQRVKAGKPVKNQWEVDYEKWKSRSN